MTTKLAEKLAETILVIILVLCILLTLSFIGLEVYILIRYSNTPISEVPAWAYWFMQRIGWGNK